MSFFKIKDLAIRVLPEEGERAALCDNNTACDQTIFTGPGCDQGTGWPCADCTLCTDSCSACTSDCSICSDCTIGCTDGCTPWCTIASKQAGPRREAAGYLANLRELRAALRQRLAVVEARQKVAAENLKPASLAEVSALEETLIEALEEIRKMKANFENDSSK